MGKLSGELPCLGGEPPDSVRLGEKRRRRDMVSFKTLGQPQMAHVGLEVVAHLAVPGGRHRC